MQSSSNHEPPCQREGYERLVAAAACCESLLSHDRCQFTSSRHVTRRVPVPLARTGVSLVTEEPSDKLVTPTTLPFGSLIKVTAVDSALVEPVDKDTPTSVTPGTGLPVL